MRAQSVIVAGFCLLVLAGCSTVKHASAPYAVAGVDVPVEVAVRYKEGDMVHGVVHHRRPNHGGPFVETPMTLRADQLYAMVPGESTVPHDTLEYYIDVSKNGKLHAIGSPMKPFTKTFLEADQIVLTHLEDKPLATDAHHDVRLVLLTQAQPVGSPSVIYQMPGVPGNIRSDMEKDFRGDYQVVIPSESVTPGTWRYAMEVTVNGTVYRFPERGYRSFQVGQGYPPKIATGAIR